MPELLQGLSAFPLTPVPAGRFDESSFARIIHGIVAAGTDSIGVLGSTGSYMYLDRSVRARAVRTAVREAAGVPVIAGIGAIGTDQVLAHAEDAQAAGAAAVLLAPVTYQALSPDEVQGLFADVCAQLSVPLVVYDNPATTHVQLSTDLYGRLAELPHVAAVKIPPFTTGGADAAAARARIAEVRAAVGSRVRIGISGDAVGALGLVSGCDLWFSAIGGILPAVCTDIVTRAREGRPEEALDASRRLAPLWRLLAVHGSLRLSQAVGELLGIVPAGSLPRPVRGLAGADLAAVAEALRECRLLPRPEGH
ncbi:dihydrodipicolinate synthase family protein [Brachybacterium hainanense]|uniref:Dihydrodipicolinate synthase family protein n=1 Tax=Brachybacterium hainanense TaxID=1541174 RepID=A0ABV6RGF6_9MICO